MKYIKGNLLDASTQALVNTVNTVGVMGKGIALQFKERFPLNFKIYLEECKKGSVVPGKLLVVNDGTLEGERTIINFPTKTEWYKKSQYSYIEEGLKDLSRIILEREIKSIAIPPLGCGNGGLKWEKVKPMIEEYMGRLEGVDIIVYEPNDQVKQILKQQDQNKDVKLTPAKAILLYAMFYYDSLGENTSLFIANKLAYFLQRLGEGNFKRLKFQALHYGPYSVQVEHMVQAMNGKFIRGLEQNELKAFEPFELQYTRLAEVSDFVKRELTSDQQNIIKQLVKLLDGFQSALSIEILASLDFVKKENPGISKEEAAVSVKWSERKKKLFKDKYIDIAWEHLLNYGTQLNFA
ncbi:macro domain-containing protein [Pedobacter psychrodurus]|uniref:type II toxin-antitoxin system antitoxin DNA ADP-ribosyl glycohydrolase DarG n=1 Tax=Pedobacter psychrodurus TaxID=2530456 RepID=UPI002931C53A|nr:macro domain-containing protein [Pedobacter psychrodurus]